MKEIFFQISLLFLLGVPIDNKSALAHVMDLKQTCHQTTSLTSQQANYMSKWWPRSVLSYAVIRPQLVNDLLMCQPSNCILLDCILISHRSIKFISKFRINYLAGILNFEFSWDGVLDWISCVWVFPEMRDGVEMVLCVMSPLNLANKLPEARFACKMSLGILLLKCRKVVRGLFLWALVAISTIRYKKTFSWITDIILRHHHHSLYEEDTSLKYLLILYMRVTI